MWQTIGGKQIAITERPISLYTIGDFLDPRRGRLLRSYEVQRLRDDNFPWGELDITGEFWTMTKVSCSLNCAWRVTPGGVVEIVPGGWDKTFMAWGIAVPK